MKPLVPAGLLALMLSACAPGRPPAPAPTPAPAPVPQPASPRARAEPVPAPTPAPAPAPAAVREAARDWQLLDLATNQVPGVGSERALRELLANRRPARTVVVAVIDGGVDTAHVDLRANLWQNGKEVAGNGRDDDGNGYADDVRGWNFIGGPNGKDVNYDTYEVTRLHARCIGGAAAGTAPRATPSAAERARCPQIAAEFNRRRAEAEQQLPQVQAIGNAFTRILPLLRQAAGTDSLTPERVAAIQGGSPEVQRGRQIYLQLAANGITPAELEEAQTELESRLQYNLNPQFDPRAVVGDSYTNVAERRYGNTDVVGPDAKHGTHVAGIIAAARGNSTGIDGVAPAVRIMVVRAVPNGDERDKDVANAIRYAVDNGAHIINMSFGKGFSPYKGAVDAAVKYADARGVLMVHAAGNDGADLSQEPNFPTDSYVVGGEARSWIEVGASSWKGRDSLAAPFSNYGRTHVDVFAPGVDILSTVPGGGYERQSGTSMAAPVVSGVAALLMSYFPSLTASDVKRIILESATRHTAQPVVKPGEGGAKVPFGTLSATGAVVNAYEAVRRAETARGSQP